MKTIKLLGLALAIAGLSAGCGSSGAKCPPGCTKPCCVSEKKPCPQGCTKPCCAGKTNPSR
jgi:hypothetical protein